ncbi:MAG: type IV toxin-antitoxin system AbiEi family antitoxin domain-containing protein, partial [Dactylosporangium sp.]|nr:type IV toxin-antitoxin system AbiEi family antitoxin domain-containing protein [Dactylosporangium sp.]
MDSFMVIRRVAARQDGIVTRAQAIAAGLLRHEIDGLVRSGRWARLARGVYLVDAACGDGPSWRARVRAAVASLGPHAVAVLGTAAELHGIAGLRDTEEIHVSLPGWAARTAPRADPALVIHQLQLSPDAVTRVAGIPTSTPVQTVADLILRLTRYPAVCVLDSALNREKITRDDFPAIAALLRRRRGAVAARGYLAEADGRAQSPLETRVRLRCVDGRVPPDVLQH